MPNKSRFVAIQILVFIFATIAIVRGQEDESDSGRVLPGHTSHPAGTLLIHPQELENGPECEKGLISVPENRKSKDSRNIRLYFYRIKPTTPSSLPPVVFLPGGPGGFYDDDWLKRLANRSPGYGSQGEAMRYLVNRDVILINQRGASLPDRTWQSFRFQGPGGSLRKPKSAEQVSHSLKLGMISAVEHWQAQGVDLAGYDIMNMVEDINDIRSALGYEKIVLRGTSFGSQWSMAYIQQYPNYVDRAILGGVEPLDHGYDSPEGVWNVFLRLEKRLLDSGNETRLPEISLTDAFKAIVERLEKESVEVEGRHPQTDAIQRIPVGVEDFRSLMRSGINGPRESRRSLELLPKYIFEIYSKNYDYLASRTIRERPGSVGGSLQSLLIDNSLGISKSREAKLDSEVGQNWVGELNLIYKATREVTPTPVIPDEFRQLHTAIPILMVQGDLDLSTPFENAEELMQTVSNGHLIRIEGGTHGAFDEISRHESEFMNHIDLFLNADLKDERSIREVYQKIPTVLKLPPLKFKSLSGPTLFDELKNIR